MTQVKSDSRTAAQLEARFRKRQAEIGVVGLGYVGLPLARSLYQAGFTTLRLDNDADKVAQLNAGKSYIGHIPAEEIAALVASGRFRATSDFAEVSELDAILICVPTPLTRHREPDLSFVLGIGRSIAPHLRAGQLVVLESTTYPGTTMQELRPELEAGGLKSGADFFLAYSPEREDPGEGKHLGPVAGPLARQDPYERRARSRGGAPVRGAAGARVGGPRGLGFS